jgi:hypothetical protein
MKKIIRVKTTKDAKLAERFVFEALKPGGFAEAKMPIPSLKDHLAWLSWANLKREEQPTFVVKEGNKVIAGIFGEPVEQWFDKGESEIQELLFMPEYEDTSIMEKLINEIVNFYKTNNAKQVHFWVLESDFKKNEYNKWQKIALDSFGFAYKGFNRISKWSGKPICKMEKYFQ